ncbi:hypothetical protein OUZ56_009330 [Daphnia magna]|uniref:Uncharacterized protein n=1 Tax=Daphnia magna TaxID=35525 RepID=A0ABR0AG34_9CRUS|nr:hypothetical protein OUZ56_009330 [Daphnia magna]
MRFADESESPTPSLCSLHSSLSSASSTASTSSSGHHRGHQLLLLEAPASKRDGEFAIESDSQRLVIQHATGII